MNLNFFSEGVRDFKTLFDPLERAKVQFESVWNSVNMLGVVTDHLDQDRFAILHKRAERAFLGRLNSKTIFKTLQVSQFATLPNSSEVLFLIICQSLPFLWEDSQTFTTSLLPSRSSAMPLA